MSTPAPGESWRVNWLALQQLAGGTVEILTGPNEDGMVKVSRVIVEYLPVDQLTSRVEDSPAEHPDKVALDAIARMLQDPDWAPGMLEDIRELVDSTGRDAEGDGTPTWGRH